MKTFKGFLFNVMLPLWMGGIFVVTARPQERGNQDQQNERRQQPQAQPQQQRPAQPTENRQPQQPQRQPEPRPQPQPQAQPPRPSPPVQPQPSRPSQPRDNPQQGARQQEQPRPQTQPRPAQPSDNRQQGARQQEQPRPQTQPRPSQPSNTRQQTARQQTPPRTGGDNGRQLQARSVQQTPAQGPSNHNFREAPRVPQAKEQSVFQGRRARSWQTEHKTWQVRGGYHGYRIPDASFSLYFGPTHYFHIYSLPLVDVGGYPEFEYNGYWFTLLDPVPEFWGPDWYQTDNVYINYDPTDGGYYLYDTQYPDIRLAVEPSLG